MTISEELKEDAEILKTDCYIIPIYWVLGFVLIIFGGAALNIPPVVQAGFPMIAIGFAFVVYGLNKFSSTKSGNKILVILNEMKADIQELKNRDTKPELERLDEEKPVTELTYDEKVDLMNLRLNSQMKYYTAGGFAFAIFSIIIISSLDTSIKVIFYGLILVALIYVNIAHFAEMGEINKIFRK